MSKAPSEATQIRNLKRDLTEARSVNSNCLRSLGEYRSRATKAEQEAKEWRDRFDTLLRVTEAKLNGAQVVDGVKLNLSKIYGDL